MRWSTSSRVPRATPTIRCRGRRMPGTVQAVQGPRPTATPNVTLRRPAGDLQYYNMDQVTAQAMTLYARMKGMSQTEASQAGAAPTLLTTIPATVVRAAEPRVREK